MESYYTHYSFLNLAIYRGHCSNVNKYIPISFFVIATYTSIFLKLCNRCITVYLLIPLLDGHSGYFQLFVPTSNTAINVLKHMFLYLWHKLAKIGWKDESCMYLQLDYRLPGYFPKKYQFKFPPATHESISLLSPLLTYPWKMVPYFCVNLYFSK